MKISLETQESVRKWVNRFYKVGGATERFWGAVEAYRTKNGHLPLVNDILWGMLNEDRGVHIGSGDAGLYCIDTMAMSDLLHHEGRFKEMLMHACHFTAMQCAGAQNSFPERPFNSDFSFVGSSCVPSIYFAASGAGLCFQEAKEKFLAYANDLFDSFGEDSPTRMAEDAWALISSDLEQMFEDQPKPPRFRVKPPKLIAY